MTDLATSQRDFAAAVFDPAAPHPLAGQPGFAVYRNNSARGGIDALNAAYPTIAMLVGDGRFERLALDFFRRRPPSSPVMADYGDGFADHLEDQPWIRELPYLPDVARLDRLRLESHLASDADALEARDLIGIEADGWMKLRLKLHPAARFAWLATPAMTIWLAHQDGEPAQELAPAWPAEGALFTRVAGAVSAMAVGRPQHRLRFGLRLGERIGEAATAAVSLYPDADISRLFASVIERGALLGFQRRQERNR